MAVVTLGLKKVKFRRFEDKIRIKISIFSYYFVLIRSKYILLVQDIFMKTSDQSIYILLIQDIFIKASETTNINPTNSYENKLNY